MSRERWEVQLKHCLYERVGQHIAQRIIQLAFPLHFPAAIAAQLAQAYEGRVARQAEGLFSPIEDGIRTRYDRARDTYIPHDDTPEHVRYMLHSFEYCNRIYSDFFLYKDFDSCLSWLLYRAVQQHYASD